MKLTYRDYKCDVCGHIQKIQTNHTDPCIAYCEQCSWKPSAGRYVNFNGRAYRDFRYAGG